MLHLSRYPFSTLKNLPTGSDNRGTGLLTQAAYVRRELAGAYSYLHMGKKVLDRITQIVREEMNAIDGTEIVMPSLGSKEHWMTTNRWNEVDVLFKLPASEGGEPREYALNPTHEEIVTPLMKEFIQSYKDLDSCAVYQFQTKFRNEKRAKSGVLRGREFIMKDLYSFHTSQESLDIYFERVREAYVRVFERLGIGAITHYAFASGGDFSKYSYEFQTELGIGEDVVYVCDACDQAHNTEIIEASGFVCVSCGSTKYHESVVSETGNIFKLGTRFSNAFGLSYTDAEGKMKEVYMGCYGIGISRLMGVIAERLADEKGLVWPEAIAPYTHYIIAFPETIVEATELARKLESEGASVILDDRTQGFGHKAGDADLFGIPHRIVVSKKTLENGGYEYKSRTSDAVEIRAL